MTPIQSAAISATASDRRALRLDPEGIALSTPTVAAEFDRWRRAWTRAWTGQARSRRDLIARARLAIADPNIMDHDETQRLARDVLAVLGAGGRRA
ncbi:hypothetical protein AA23498_1202 [Acetobacter nitrogenifigens DSM 23921 = NBRC 105050]|uniref:Uncharacterized protein n=1 Tax=Acetobacter nitrogenifigens DSM 23921 = NBRC 105050 TaxID=1120919 RepID=A0A511XD11_9PROT|nr:hypothetical protein [Acetobacter nitrogenifigens]GBQ91511.1 hypothetical protein AA23498_1202 [Acetobacter nitrogenifigens DSM 23921 = NBRC 105050]GEN60847.1 hypothetical protein ANI02nite_27310 [Acetobacter nitrogenifigens DSM 23921 = NBRC 105050]